MQIERQKLIKGLRLLARQLEKSDRTHLDECEYYAATERVRRLQQRQTERARPEPGVTDQVAA